MLSHEWDGTATRGHGRRRSRPGTRGPIGPTGPTGPAGLAGHRAARPTASPATAWPPPIEEIEAMPPLRMGSGARAAPLSVVVVPVAEHRWPFPEETA